MDHLQIIAIEIKKLNETASSILDFLKAEREHNPTKTNRTPAVIESQNSTAYARELGLPGTVTIQNHQYWYSINSSKPRDIGHSVADAHRWLEKEAEKINHQ